MSYAPFIVAIWIFFVGLYGVITSRHLVHLVICISVVQSSTYLLLLAIGYRTNGAASIFVDIPLNTKAVDPVVKALALTDIVVGAAVTALLLAIAVQAQKRFGTVDPDELDPLRD
jgi:multicomponent Na+:H+ antiporter subunit C